MLHCGCQSKAHAKCCTLWVALWDSVACNVTSVVFYKGFADFGFSPLQESGGRFSTPGSAAAASRAGGPSQGPQGSTKSSKTHLQADPETRTAARPNGLLVCLDEHVISKWRFDANNVLAWDGNPAAGSEWTAGWSGWLQFIQVPESSELGAERQSCCAQWDAPSSWVAPGGLQCFDFWL